MRNSGDGRLYLAGGDLVAREPGQEVRHYSKARSKSFPREILSWRYDKERKHLPNVGVFRRARYWAKSKLLLDAANG